MTVQNRYSKYADEEYKYEYQKAEAIAALF